MLRRFFVIMAAGAAVFAAPPSSLEAQVPGVEGTLVVVNKGASTANVIDVESGEILATLRTGGGPHEVAMSADGTLAVVTDYESGATLTVIDVPGLAVMDVIQLDGHRGPHGIAFMPDDETVAVTTERSRHVLIVDVTDGTITRELPTEGRGSHMLAIPVLGTTVFTADIGDNTVTEIGIAAGGPTRKFDVPDTPEAIGVHPDGSEVWVGSNTTGLVSVVYPATGEVETALEGFGWPYRVVFSPDGETVIIPDLNTGDVRIVDSASREERAVLSFPGQGPQGVTFSPDGATAFLALSRADRVAVIDVATATVVGTLASTGRPDGVAYTEMVLGP